MDASVKKLGDLLLVTVPEHLLDSEMVQLRRAVSRAGRAHRSRWVLLDFSAVEICDSFFGRFVQSVAQVSRLQGASVIVTGLQDGIVETMVELGFDLADIKVTLDVDDALEYAAGARSKDATSKPGGEGAADGDVLDQPWHSTAAGDVGDDTDLLK